MDRDPIHSASTNLGKANDAIFYESQKVSIDSATLKEESSIEYLEKQLREKLEEEKETIQERESCIGFQNKLNDTLKQLQVIKKEGEDKTNEYKKRLNALNGKKMLLSKIHYKDDINITKRVKNEVAHARKDWSDAVNAKITNIKEQGMCAKINGSDFNQKIELLADEMAKIGYAIFDKTSPCITKIWNAPHEDNDDGYGISTSVKAAEKEILQEINQFLAKEYQLHPIPSTWAFSPSDLPDITATPFQIDAIKVDESYITIPIIDVGLLPKKVKNKYAESKLNDMERSFGAQINKRCDQWIDLVKVKVTEMQTERNKEMITHMDNQIKDFEAQNKSEQDNLQTTITKIEEIDQRLSELRRYAKEAVDSMSR